MSRLSPREIEELFDAVADLPAERQLSELDRLSGGRAELRAAVVKLLRIARADAGGLLDRPAVVGVELEGAARPAGVTRVGPYRVLSLIGEGGMGVVYEAEQQNPRRVVALKVIRPGLMTAGLIRRFEREAAALGLLQHSGIACVYEAGVAPVEGGTPGVTVPFIAMELVRGLPLMAFAGERALGVRERADLVARLADAVQHAHERGVIHRDLKPGNVLVDGQGQPKILDFGIAKLAEGAAADETRHTLTGQIMGTLEYMSPEQLSGDPTRIDARCDVYALGVILYELLAGKPPHEVREMSIPAAAEVIREGVVARLEAVTSGTGSRVDADLSTIAGRALEKDPLRRYASAGELAADLRRYLRDEPIVARPTTAMYQLRRFARRHRALVWGAAATVLALAVGLVGMAVLAARESRARVLAEERLAAADRQSYRASLAAAKMAIEMEDRPTAQHQMAQAPAALRGWEWELMERASSPRESIVLPMAPAQAATVISADGELVGLARPAEALERRTGRVVTRFAGAEAALPMQLLPQIGRAVLIAADGSSIRVHEMPSGSLVRLIETPERVEWPPPMSDDGRLVAWVVGRGETVRVMDVASGQLVRELVGGEAKSAIAFQPGGRRLAMGTERTRLVDVDSGAELWDAAGGVQSFSADGRFVAVTESTPAGYVARVLDAETGVERGRAPIFWLHRFSRPGVVFSADGSLLAMHDRESSVGVFETGTMREVGRALTPPGGGNVLALTDSPMRLVLCRHLGSCDEWDAPAPAGMASLTLWESPGSAASAVSRDGRLVARGEWGALAVMDGATGRPLWRRSHDLLTFGELAFDDAGTTLAGIEGKFGLSVFDVASGERRLRRVASPGQAQLTGIVWSAARGWWVVSERQEAEGGEVSAVRWLSPGSIEPGEQLWRGAGEVLGMAAAGSTLAVLERTTGADGAARTVVHVLDALSGRVVDTHAGVDWTHVAIEQGKLFVGTGEGMVRRLTQRGEERFIAANSPVFALTMSPDGTRLVASCADGNAYVWDAREPGQEPLAVLRPNTERLRTAMRFSESGDRLVVISPHRLSWFDRRALPPSAAMERALMPLAFAAADGRRAATSELDRSVVAMLGDTAAWLNSDAWGISMLRASTPEARARALELAERANVAADGQSAAVLNTLGLALYRVGRLDEALAMLDRSEVLYERTRGRGLPANSYIAAMVHVARGDTAAAQSALQAAEALAAKETAPLDADSRALREQALEYLMNSSRRAR